MMAEAQGKLTGRPGIAFVTRGPGRHQRRAPASTSREQDSTPLILFVGQIDRACASAKPSRSSTTGRSSARSPNGRPRSTTPRASPNSSRAPSTSRRSGRPGPVVIALPEDMLTERVAVADAPRVEPVETAPGAGRHGRAARCSRRPMRPLVILGGTRWTAEARAASRASPSASTCRSRPASAGCRSSRPITRTMRAMSASPIPKLTARVKEADLLLLVGGRLAEMPSPAYTLLDIPCPRPTLVHVIRTRRARPRLSAGPRHQRLARRLRGRARGPAAAARDPPGAARARRRMPTTCLERAGDAAAGRRQARRGHDRGCATRCRPTPSSRNGAGNFAIWVHRFCRFRGYAHATRPDLRLHGLRRAGRHRGEARPSRTAPWSCFAGDGDFLMNGQEFATAVQYDLPIV